MHISSNRAVARISLSNIVHNINEFKKIKSEITKVCAVVKADAYGHGSVEVSKFIEKHIDYFAVSTGDEALELRSFQITKPILILGYVFDNEIENLIRNDVEFAIYNLDIANTINKIAEINGLIAKVHIKLDTGMSRIGFLSQNDYIDEIKKVNCLSNVSIVGCFSHFSNAEETKNEVNDIQFDLFQDMCKKIENENINLGIKHISNSAASEKNNYNLDMIRIGIGMYGYSYNDEINPNIKLKPAMKLESLVSNVKLLKKGCKVSYGGKYILEKDEWIATVPIGYADGINRSLSCKNFEVVLENGVRGICVGNICMDQMMIKLPKKVDIGTKVYIFGYNDDSGYNMAKLADTIIYEIVCGINKRVKREYEI